MIRYQDYIRLTGDRIEWNGTLAVFWRYCILLAMPYCSSHRSVSGLPKKRNSRNPL